MAKKTQSYLSQGKDWLLDHANAGAILGAIGGLMIGDHVANAFANNGLFSSIPGVSFASPVAGGISQVITIGACSVVGADLHNLLFE